MLTGAGSLRCGFPHNQLRFDGDVGICSNGLANVPGPGSHCPYLVFDDFGTTGLDGDVTQWHKVEGTRNGFFTFFRAEGQSDKE